MRAKHVVVHGRVQGVSFRAAAADAATDLGVAGRVRNRDDGTVEMVLEGDDDAVGRMLDWARSGPPHADVTDLDVTDRGPEGLSGFAAD